MRMIPVRGAKHRQTIGIGREVWEDGSIDSSGTTRNMRMDPIDKSLPLTEADIDRLEAILDSDLFQGEAMLLDELQGFLCGISSGPEPVAPSEWLPVVLGQDPHYESSEQGEEVLALILRFHAQIVGDLNEGRMPQLILYPADEDGETYDYAPWADGFLLGSDVGPTPWLEAAGEHAEELAELLEPFFLLNGTLKEDISKSGQRWLSAAEEARALAAAEEELPGLVLAIHSFWKAIAGTAEAFVGESDNVGRNQRCPCGSGRNFKQCCGDPKRLH